jgi:hypothetical protein
LLEEMERSSGRKGTERDKREAYAGAEEVGETEMAARTSRRLVGTEELVLRNRYELAKARILHFGAFEFRPEWRREREGRLSEGHEGEKRTLGTR